MNNDLDCIVTSNRPSLVRDPGTYRDIVIDEGAVVESKQKDAQTASSSAGRVGNCRHLLPASTTHYHHHAQLPCQPYARLWHGISSVY